MDVVILILWIAIYAVDSAIQLSNNQGQVETTPTQSDANRDLASHANVLTGSWGRNA